MSDTIPTESNASGVELPDREQIRRDLDATLGNAQPDNTLVIPPHMRISLRRMLTVAERYAAYGLVSGREHGEAIERRRRAEGRAVSATRAADKARRKAKRLKARLKALREDKAALHEQNRWNIQHANDRMRERDEARTALVEAMRIEEQRRQTLLQIKRAIGEPGDGANSDKVAKVRRILAVEKIAEQMQVPKDVIDSPSITIVNPMQDAKEAAERIIDQMRLASGEGLIDIPEVAERPTVGQPESKGWTIRQVDAFDVKRGDLTVETIDSNAEPREVSCTHLLGNGVQICWSEGSPAYRNYRRGDQVNVSTPEETVAVSAGGWCAPSDALYSFFPEVRVERGGISFTRPKSLTKKQLRAQNDRLVEGNTALRKENRKLRKKVRRLTKAVNRLASA